MAADFDIVVIGGGHAGCEAALASARLGLRTALVTLRRDRIGHMPCNPAVGGLGKGHLVKELDALGGEIGYATDRAGIQFRMLNRSKGAAVRAPRAQADKVIYSRVMARVCADQENLEVIEAEVEALEVFRGSFKGVRISGGVLIEARSCVLTAGTFLRGLMHTGHRQRHGGREGEPPAHGLAASLRSLGLRVGRLKTGTPPRILRDSVDLSSSQFSVQGGDQSPALFSHRSTGVVLRQVDCHLTHTTERVHDIIRDNLSRSPLYAGVIEGTGPRYCPSIEDKVVRFPDRTRHQVFVEPEGLDHPELYLNGISTSLPEDVQQKILGAIPGLETARMARPGYAVEYDFFPPDQIQRTMESKYIERLYFAGQVNGTSGYEEAAAQGFIAGINAALKIIGRDEFVPRRDEAYIGVMVDDLTTKEIDEPYRMFTSRAEFRLLLSQDNADERLMAHGVKFGLVKPAALEKVVGRTRQVDEVVYRLETTGFPAGSGNDVFGEIGLDPVRKNVTLGQVLRRPGVTMEHLRKVALLGHDREVDSFVESKIKYAGYIDRQERDVRSVRDLEKKRIPADFSYDTVTGLSHEAAEKLSSKRPETMGQASRIAGVRAADLSILAVFLERARRSA